MSDSADRVKDLLEHVSDALALDADVVIEEEGRIIKATLEGDDLGLFIGRHGHEAAEKAVDSGRPVALDAMSATERKVVHEYLKDRDDVETYSEGTEPDRHLVVAPLEG